ncbi:hypothetical protein SAMN04487972_12037 [Paracoccus halophilus]|uniref:Uncharacterized protein n=1 Tax=Paracoccus halophilus TaxID=376733 RepID=A0A099EZ89_9RHOB|nr:hypothetical protein IT41_14735 [Paracoccus halophilus]SFA58391.1 hypothetical protein SAMN04487972_12037 [Paracoccus halophilus]
MRFQIKGCRSLVGALFIAAPILSSNPSQAYQIDCAILLCLAGGWPSSTECAAARTEFIRRITPWPIEPPLQIWRCPMGASLNSQSPMERLWSISTTALPEQSLSPDSAFSQLIEAQAVRPRRVDLSASDFEFIRSIKVYDVDWWQWNHRNSEGDDICWRARRRANIGTYDQQGAFNWHSLDIYDAPTWMEVSVQPRGDCEAEGRFRGVGIEWNDYFGEHGFELVRY